jgi:hypothetical protein
MSHALSQRIEEKTVHLRTVAPILDLHHESAEDAVELTLADQGQTKPVT